MKKPMLEPFTLFADRISFEAAAVVHSGDWLIIKDAAGRDVAKIRGPVSRFADGETITFVNPVTITLGS